MPWFLWQGERSDSMGLWINELPAPIRARERVEEITIPGRAGTLLFREGENIHDGYVKDCKVIARSDANFARILNWLSGSGEVVFSNEPDRVYTATISGEVKFSRLGNSLKQATVPFYVNPHKGMFPTEAPIVLGGNVTSKTVYNPGNVVSKPLIVINFEGSMEIEISGNHQRFFEIPAEGISVDSDAELITSDGVIWTGNFDSDFLTLSPGNNEIVISESLASVTIYPRWRWY